MSILQYVSLYLLTVPVFFIIDLLWLGVIAKPFYRIQLAGFLGDVNWPAAVGFYLVYIVGIIIFAVAPGIARESLMYTLMFGALFGFFTYATYDLTNLATMDGWPLKVVVVDILWGTILSASVAVASYKLAQLFIL